MSEYYENLIKNLDDEKIINLMTTLGANRYVDKEDFIIFPTICHNINADEASMKLYYYKDNKFFYCYTACGGQSIFNFLKTYYETRNYEYNWTEDIIKVVQDCSNYKKQEGLDIKPSLLNNKKLPPKKNEISLKTYSPQVLDVFVKRYPPEWLNDGITKEAMDKFNIKYSISQNKIIIPHYDINNNLVGIRGRALNEWEIENVGKYMPVKIEDTWYTHKLSLNLYGLNHNLENIKQNKIVYLFEGEKSVLQLEGFNIPNCGVAICGSNFNKYALNILLKNCYPDEIIICFDKEELPNEDKYFMKLFNICKKYNKYCKFSFIYDRENLLNLKESPTDRGEGVFKKLLEKRVKVK